MQSMQRRFGRLTTAKSADNSQVAVLLKDFEDADNLFTKIVESTKAWRDAWVSIATFQSRLADEFDGLYAPILASSETETRHTPQETPKALLTRTSNLRREYDELRGDLLEELQMVERRMSQPAEQAKSYLAPVKKSIKKRNEKKSEFERFQSKYDSLIHKPKRSDRENAALAKAEADLTVAKEIYQQADHDLMQRLPTLISLLFSLAPFILQAQVEIQNRMLAHYYTVLSGYFEDEGWPNPPPPMDQVIQTWEDANNGPRAEIDSMAIVAHGKALRMTQESQNKRPSIGGRSISTMSSVSSNRSAQSLPRYNVPPPMPGTKPYASEFRSPSPSSSTRTPPISVASASSTPPPYAGYDSHVSSPPAIVPNPFLHPSAPPSCGPTFSPAGPNVDYFQQQRRASSTAVSTPGASDPFAVASLKKKKPPPPPRAASYVTAIYDFGGQSQGDLSFQEGDRIRVIRKTDSTDDWWEGELRGVKGAFPANYVE
ncbi:Uncharacterized protein PECH_003836 [Penicillium ucsense]|uniref:SH3 domain-containing protein n=1 Tax=Penicillium ucsense TaxID=2839758 RepID=A0A8J8WF71_9EURO|nr:Uncharacterized protein PECM_001707 [Penicillium ucsense]KAF7737385.1 Uncharacterized protein PECH_003836 [Penicillium ucsense]